MAAGTEEALDGLVLNTLLSAVSDQACKMCMCQPLLTLIAPNSSITVLNPFI